MLRDLRHGLRVLLQASGWTAVVILSLAVGIGANAAIFNSVQRALLAQLPVADPDGLVRLRWVGDNDMVNDSSDYGYSAAPDGDDDRIQATFSYALFRAMRTANQTMTDMAAGAPASRLTAVIDERAEAVSGYMATGNLHTMLGLRPALGRLITPDDDQLSAPPVAMISEPFWRTRFGGDAEVIGRTIRINDVPISIVGVLPKGYTGIQRNTGQHQDLAIPLSLSRRISSDPGRLDNATDYWLQIVGRLRPGESASRVQGNLDGVFQAQAEAGMDSYLASLPSETRGLQTYQNRTAVPRLDVASASRGVYDVPDDQMRALSMLSAVVILLLLLVCANVANLLLSRAASREREIAVRLSIGATRGRVVRQLLTESVLLSFLGAAAGLLAAQWMHQLLPPQLGGESSQGWEVVVFTFGLALAAGLAFGLAPALRATRHDAGPTLKDESRSVSASTSPIARALLVSQVAISLILLVGAGLFLQTLDNLRRVDIGFDPSNLVHVRVGPDVRRYNDTYRRQYYERAVERLNALPGVRAATLSVPTLMSGSVNGTQFFVQGRDYPRERDRRSRANDIHRVVIAPNFFDAMGIRIVSGRAFTDADDARAPKVAIINQAAVRKFFGNDNPIGARFGSAVDSADEYEVVGVLQDVRYNSLREDPPATVYLPYLQRGTDGLVFSLRTSGDAAAMLGVARRAVAETDPNIPVVTVETQVSQLERRYQGEQVLARAYALFAAIALFIAAIGLFGVMSYTVSRRTREIGIRVALGAHHTRVLNLVLRESMLLVFIGIVVGIAAALGAGQLIASQLFGIEPHDVVTLAIAAATMSAAAGIAAFVPARRATRVDPMVALRYE